jgi:hypothetical protein
MGGCLGVGVARGHVLRGPATEKLRAFSRMHARLGAEPGGSADEGIAPFVETQESVGGVSNADAFACADEQGSRLRKRLRSARRPRLRLGHESAEPEGSRGAQVEAVEPAVDLKSGSETARAACQLEEARGFSVKLHLLEAFERFERADEDAASDVREFRGDIEHEMIAVGEVHVSVATAEKHRTIARCGTSIVVGRGIARGIRFGLDDAAGEPAVGEFADYDFADEEACERHGAGGKLRAPEAANPGAGSVVIHRHLRLSLVVAESKS